MQTDLFDYPLPAERIAQHSVEPRDQAKMLVLNRAEQNLEDRHIADLPEFLQTGDLLVFNDSKVFKARLMATKNKLKAEIFLLRPVESTHASNLLWMALVKPGKKINVGDELDLSDGTAVRVKYKHQDGEVEIDFGMSVDDVFALCDRIGEVPLPPYVRVGAGLVPAPSQGDVPSEGHPQGVSLQKYQTIYARVTGSVAAPTAGFHFTKELFARLEAKGVRRAFVTLHVGVGTFRPMKTETLEEHEMHEEWAYVSEETLKLIAETKNAGHRVIVVGTTAMRALESAAAEGGAEGPRPYSGYTRLFITPGYPFKIADGLLTNFHLPKSTLLVLVSSFAGREYVLDAYQYAIENDYRFYSFGDAMLII